jgi:hypothetical protein
MCSGTKKSLAFLKAKEERTLIALLTNFEKKLWLGTLRHGDEKKQVDNSSSTQ